MRALVLANGDLCSSDALPEAELLICADGGARHAIARGLSPDIVVGDLDSLPPGVRSALGNGGTQFVQYPRAKDETDLELALLYAVERGATEILVYAVRGGRVDHELGNLLLLAHPALRAVDVRLRAGMQEVFLASGQAVLRGAPGDLISLLPIGGDAHGITTEGLQYRLSKETLLLGAARGVSNVLVGTDARLDVEQGLLLVVHTHQHAP
ncbi:MAG: thiamine diphosphokinase [Anaerolineae bacterium]|nr:thiamine diphosphokinase [Anaerolineae bacterium]